eukprot:Rmarinus@m.11585
MTPFVVKQFLGLCLFIYHIGFVLSVSISETEEGTWEVIFGNFSSPHETLVSVETQLLISKPNFINIKEGTTVFAIQDVLVWNNTLSDALYGSNWKPTLQPRRLIDWTLFGMDTFIDDAVSTYWRHYAGTFEQTFDLQWYPYDEPELDIVLEVESSFPYQDSETHVYIDSSESATVEIARFEKDGVSFRKLTCGFEDSTSIFCRFLGERQHYRTDITILFPVCLFVLIAWLSLCYQMSQFMPRVSQSLFSLLLTTHFRNSVQSQLPQHHYTPFLTGFLTVCVFFISFILVIHMASEVLQRRKLVFHQHALDVAMIATFPFVFFFVLLCTTLNAKGFLSSEGAVALVTCVSVVAMFAAALLFRYIVKRSVQSGVKLDLVRKGCILMRDFLFRRGLLRLGMGVGRD